MKKNLIEIQVDQSRGIKKSNFRSRRNVEWWNYGKTCHIKKHCKTPKKKEENKCDVANTIIEKIHDVFLL